RRRSQTSRSRAAADTPGRNQRTAMIGTTTKLRMILALGLFAALIPAAPAHANTHQTQSRVARSLAAPPAASAVALGANVVTVTALAADVSATAEPGDGVIRLYQRACGAYPSDAQWQAAAAANNIAAPVYLVLLGQRLTFTCSVSPPAPSAAQPEATTSPA